MRIMIVHPDLQPTAEYLRGRGYEVKEVWGNDLALRVAEAFAPDAVLYWEHTEPVAPHEDALKVLVLAGLRVVLAARRESALVPFAGALGIRDFVFLPAGPEEVLRRLENPASPEEAAEAVRGLAVPAPAPARLQAAREERARAGAEEAEEVLSLEEPAGPPAGSGRRFSLREMLLRRPAQQAGGGKGERRQRLILARDATVALLEPGVRGAGASTLAAALARAAAEHKISTAAVDFSLASPGALALRLGLTAGDAARADYTAAGTVRMDTYLSAFLLPFRPFGEPRLPEVLGRARLDHRLVVLDAGDARAHGDDIYHLADIVVWVADADPARVGQALVFWEDLERPRRRDFLAVLGQADPAEVGVLFPGAVAGESVPVLPLPGGAADALKVLEVICQIMAQRRR